MVTAIQRSALLPYTAEQMYQLINQVEAYPQYLDGCVGAELISQSESHMEARLDLAKAGLNYSFITRNTLTPNSKVVMELVDGPFNKLNGRWLLTPLSEEACKVSLELEYEFSNKMFDLAFGRIFNHLTNNMVQAFILRAKDVYGVKV